MNKKKACIIGGGLGGLAIGALLSKKGYQTEIFEKEAVLGGRALSLDGSLLTLEEYTKVLSTFKMKLLYSEPSPEMIFNKKLLKNYRFDLGFHLVGGGNKSVAIKILKDCNKFVNMNDSKVGFLRDDGYSFSFLTAIDKIKIFPRFLQLILSSESTMKKLDSVNVSDTIKRYGQGKMSSALEIFSRAATTNNELDKISTGETLRSTKDFIKGLVPVGYPAGGLQSLSKAFADVVLSNGGKIKTNTPVEKIIIEDNKAKGIIIAKENHFYNLVISNVPVQNLFYFVDKNCFPRGYLEYLKELKGTGSVCAYYSLKKVNDDFLGKTFIFIERDADIAGKDAVGMIDFMTALPRTGLAPLGHYLVQSYIICTPEEAKNKEIAERLKNILDKWLEKLIPDLQSQMNWALYPVVWHLDGVAKTIDNVKPDIRTPVKNLYLVGDCVKAPGIGINCAVNSARVLMDFLEQSDN